MFPNRTWRFLPLPGVFAVAGLLLSPANAQQNPSEVEDHFRAAQQDQQQGKLDSAVQEYKAVLRLQPGLAEAYVNLGLVYYAQTKYDESAHALSTAAKLKPGMRGVSLWLGIDDVQLHRSAQAVTLLHEAVRLDPEDKLAESWLATALWDEGQFDAALLQLGKACVKFPDDPDLLFARGEAYGKAASQQMNQLLEESSGTALSDLIYGTHYVEQHEWTKAEGHLRRAIDRDPRLLDVRLELAEAYLEQASVSAAQEQLDRALVMAPRSASALALAGELLLLEQQPSEGLARIEKAIAIESSEALDALKLPAEDRLDPTDHGDADTKLATMCRKSVEALEADATTSPAKDVALAALYALAGDEDASMRAYRRIGGARSSPDSPVNLFAKAVAAMHQHCYEDAEALLLRRLAADPSDRLARYDLALVRRQIARSQVIRLVAVAPDSYHVHQLLGQIYVNSEEDDKALTEYLAVASARPDLPGVHFWLGHLYWKHGDADHARTELARELELSPGHPEANAELGTVLVAEEHAAEAIPHLESAIRSKPDLWPAYSQLGRAYSIEKKYLRAEEVLKHALVHDQDGSAHYQLGLVLRAEGKTAQAAQVFAKVRAIKNEQMTSPSTVDASDQSISPGAKQ
jgi:tetratricopeptide (TPR) repeat protein